MAKDKVLVDGVTTSLADTIQTIYTPPTNGGSSIKAVTASNKTGINASYKMYIVRSDGDLSNPEIAFQIVPRFKSDPGAGVINHVIPAGGTLRVSTSQEDSIAFRVTGVEITL